MSFSLKWNSSSSLFELTTILEAVLADELNTLFPGVRVVGCTSAGEIGPGVT